MRAGRSVRKPVVRTHPMRLSLTLKIIFLFVVFTLLNVAAVVAVIFLTQSSLMAEKTDCDGLRTGCSLKGAIDAAVAKDSALTTANLNAILQKAGGLGIATIAVYGERGNAYFIVEDNRQISAAFCPPAELPKITKAIQSRRTEGKLFVQEIPPMKGPVSLYIPFSFGTSGTAVAVVKIPRSGISAAAPIMPAAIGGGSILVLQILFLAALLLLLIFPLRKLIAVSRTLLKADTIARVPIVRDDEIGALASTFNELGIMLQRARDEIKGGSPITGLPGGATIVKYIDEILAAGHLISVLACDIDNFKSYNDKYGFAKGDEVILYARDCLIAVAQRKDMPGCFVGHFGGDDFIVVCPYEMWENFAKTFVTTFDRGIYQFYNSTDARNGYIESTNRVGQRKRFGLMSISIAIVTNKTRPFRRYAEVAQVAAEVMKYVKTIEGSGYAIDRRQGAITQEVRQNPATPPPSRA
jgi:diguanylate cyclase (GGDEF)-like protein